MSDEVLAPLLTVAVLIALFVWVPTLHVCNARCQDLLRLRSSRRETLAERTILED